MRVELVLEKFDGRWVYSAVVNGQWLTGSKVSLIEVFEELEEAVTIDI